MAAGARGDGSPKTELHHQPTSTLAEPASRKPHSCSIAMTSSSSSSHHPNSSICSPLKAEPLIAAPKPELHHQQPLCSGQAAHSCTQQPRLSGRAPPNSRSFQPLFFLLLSSPSSVGVKTIFSNILLKDIRNRFEVQNFTRKQIPIMPTKYSTYGHWRFLNGLKTKVS